MMTLTCPHLALYCTRCPHCRASPAHEPCHWAFVPHAPCCHAPHGCMHRVTMLLPHTLCLYFFFFFFLPTSSLAVQSLAPILADRCAAILPPRATTVNHRP